MASAPDNNSQKSLTEAKNCSTDLLGRGRGAESQSNAKYNLRGHKSSDRKTGLAQTDEHYSWKQVYYACSADIHAHEEGG